MVGKVVDRNANQKFQADLQNRVADVEGKQYFLLFKLASLPGSVGGLPVQMVLRSPLGYPRFISG